MTDLEIKNEKKVLGALRKKQAVYRRHVQVDLGIFLDFVRQMAADRVMIHPAAKTYFERSKVKTTPGKLTTRTGRMRFLLKEKLGMKWTPAGKLLYKKQTSAFKMQAKVVRTNKLDVGFLATIRVHISSIPHRVAWTGSGRQRMPMATRLTLKMRFSWEYRGRPVLSVASKMHLHRIRRIIQNNLDKYLGGVV